MLDLKVCFFYILGKLTDWFLKPPSEWDEDASFTAIKKIVDAIYGVNDSAECECSANKLYKKFGSRNLVFRTGMFHHVALQREQFHDNRQLSIIAKKICILFNNQTNLFIILNLVSLVH